MTPTIGRILQYRLSDADAQQIWIRRDDAQKNHDVLLATARGTQHHVGNPVSGGLIVPLIVTAVWPNEYGDGVPGVNGQALLDGNDSLWVTSAREGDDAGTWSWPPRV